MGNGAKGNGQEANVLCPPTSVVEGVPAIPSVAEGVSALDPGSCCRGEAECSLSSYIPATIS